MSHNLHCEEVELYQTPTWVTEICLSYNPETKQNDGDWRGVLRRYLIWVEGTLNGTYKTKSDHDWAKSRVKEHIQNVLDARDRHGRLTFSWT